MTLSTPPRAAVNVIDKVSAGGRGMGRIGLWMVSLSCCEAATAASAQETPKDIIAAHLRLQGYACDAPKSARRDPRASRPDEAVWIIVCENARYRVRLVPDMADVVEAF